MSTVNRDRVRVALREFRKYSGDGAGGTGALPIGDPASGAHSPPKSLLREAFEPLAEGLDTISEAVPLVEDAAAAGVLAVEQARIDAQIAAEAAQEGSELARDASEGFRNEAEAFASSAGTTILTNVAFTPSGTGAATRTVDAKLREPRRSADDYSTLTAAIAEADTDGVFIPEGTISSASGVVAADAQALVLYGRGEESIIQKQAGAVAGPVYAFDGKTKLYLESLASDLAVDTTATNGVNLFRSNHSDIELVGLIADGNVTIDVGTGARSHLASLTTVEPSTNMSGLKISFSKFTNFYWGFLQANTTVATMKDISVVFSEFDEFGSVALLFNAPAVDELIENVQIIGNKLGSNRSRQPFGGIGFTHRGSFAGNVHYARLIGNHATGYGGELFRSEEGARGVIMALNTAKLDGRDGIEIISNNVGGTAKAPRFFNVDGNILDHRGLVSDVGRGWGIGLQTYTDVAGLADAECLNESVVHDNIMHGWAEGLRTHYGMQRNLVHHNVVAENTAGLITFGPSLGVHDTLLVENALGVRFEAGGILGRIHLRGTGVNGVYQSIQTAAASAPGAVDAWTWESGRFSLADGSTFVDLIPRGLRIEGRITASLARDNAVYSFEVGRLVWDGATLTYYREQRTAAGGVIISSASPFGLTSTNVRLAIHLVNAAGVASPNCRLQVKFDGLHVWS